MGKFMWYIRHSWEFNMIQGLTGTIMWSGMGTVSWRKSSGTMAGILVITFSSLWVFFTDAWYRSKVPWESPWAYKLSACWKRVTPEDMVVHSQDVIGNYENIWIHGMWFNSMGNHRKTWIHGMLFNSMGNHGKTWIHRMWLIQLEITGKHELTGCDLIQWKII